MKKRLRDIGEAMAWIETSQALGPAARSRQWFPWAVAATALAVAFAAVLFQRMTPDPSYPPLARFSVSAPPGYTLVAEGASMAISPDGLRLAFIVTDSSGTTRLCDRKLDALAEQLLPGTDAAMLP